MKVFISHQKADTATAAAIATRLQVTHQIECYLDTIDANLHSGAELLAEYIRRELGKCTQLLAVVSSSTKESQWVPWEIGVATEKDFPLATYCGDSTQPPEFLRKWPYLRSLHDVDYYANASKSAERVLAINRSILKEDRARRLSTADFFRALRASLGQ
jgi:hypothetical protein